MRVYVVLQEPQETLGISVAGGIDSPRGDTPIYITNINLTGCLGKTRQVKVSHSKYKSSSPATSCILVLSFIDNREHQFS